MSTVGACAASVYAQSGYAATTHRTAHSNTTFRPGDALTGRARTQPTTKPEGRTLAEREQLDTQLRVAQAHVAMSHQHAATVAALGDELFLTCPYLIRPNHGDFPRIASPSAAFFRKLDQI